MAGDSGGGMRMLPDERQVITARISDLDELDDDEFLSTDQLADKLGFERP